MTNVFHCVSIKPIKFIPIKYEAAKKKVVTNELVIVNVYGINPIMLDDNKNKNKKKSEAKYCDLFKFVLFFKTLRINL